MVVVVVVMVVVVVVVLGSLPTVAVGAASPAVVCAGSLGFTDNVEGGASSLGTAGAVVGSAVVVG